MIEKLNNTQLDLVMSIWLNANILTHDFIPKSYWEQMYPFAKNMIPNASVYVYTSKDTIVGFIGVADSHIEGIFIDNALQSKGYGKQLLDYVKNINQVLTLNVYTLNKKALRFYLREGFEIIGELTNSDTNQKEFLMKWNR